MSSLLTYCCPCFHDNYMQSHCLPSHVSYCVGVGTSKRHSTHIRAMLQVWSGLIFSSSLRSPPFHTSRLDHNTLQGSVPSASVLSKPQFSNPKNLDSECSSQTTHTSAVWQSQTLPTTTKAKHSWSLTNLLTSFRLTSSSTLHQSEYPACEIYLFSPNQLSVAFRPLTHYSTSIPTMRLFLQSCVMVSFFDSSHILQHISRCQKECVATNNLS